jgi:comEA protein
MVLRLPVSRFPLFVLFAGLLFASSVPANKKPPLEPVNINTAGSEELQKVPGIGPVTAEKILNMRKLRGPFRSVNELRAIKGIGPKRLAKMKPYLTVGDSDDGKGSRAAKPAKAPN